MRIHVNVNIKLNKLVRYFVVSDLVLLAGWGLIEPIFSIFVVDTVRNATIVTVGTAVGIYWILKSIIQIPLATFLDKYDGERDDFYALILGIMITGGSAVLFAFVHEIWQLYLVQAMHAVGFALYFVAWPSIFSRHLDKDKVSFEWALDNTAASIGAGASAFLGGFFVSKFGFQVVFVSAGALCALSALTLMLVPEFLFPKKTTAGIPAKLDQI